MPAWVHWILMNFIDVRLFGIDFRGISSVSIYLGSSRWMDLHGFNWISLYVHGFIWIHVIYMDPSGFAGICLVLVGLKCIYGFAWVRVGFMVSGFRAFVIFRIHGFTVWWFCVFTVSWFHSCAVLQFCGFAV